MDLSQIKCDLHSWIVAVSRFSVKMKIDSSRTSVRLGA